MIKSQYNGIIIIKSTNLLEIYNTLVEVSSAYNPPLTESIEDLYKYAIKLSESAEFYIAKGKIILGCIAFYCNDTTEKVGYITQIGIKTEAQSLGIGKKLINIAYSICKEKEMKTIMLEVRKSNDKAIEFYRKQGFETSSEISMETIYMVKKLK